MIYMTREGIKKIVITDYYLLAGEVVLGYIFVQFFPQIPPMIILCLVLVNLSINIAAHLFVNWKKAPLFFIQAFILLEMIVATASVTVIFHYFTDVRPILMVAGYVPIILFSAQLNAIYGIATIASVALTYFSLYSVENSGIWPISNNVLFGSSCGNWSRISFFSLLVIVAIGILIVAFKNKSSRDHAKALASNNK